MANYRKSFNFRSGVQVDNDKFLVDGRGNVGVGTSAPNRPLDVYGTARVNGLLESTLLNVSSASTFQSLVSVGNSIFFNPSTGIITAVSYRGDGALLANVIAIATDGWVKNAGTLSTSFNIYQGPFTDGVLPVSLGPLQVGVGATAFLVGFDGTVGIGTTVTTRTLDVRGGIGATNLSVTGPSTLSGTVKFGGGTEILSSGELKLAEGNRIMLNYSGSTPNGLVIRWTSAFGSEILDVGGSPITINSDNGQPIFLKDDNTEFASFRDSGVTLNGITTTTHQSVSGISTFGGNIIQTSGSVGFGTTNPVSKLHVIGHTHLADTLGVEGLATTRNLRVSGITTVENFKVNQGSVLNTLNVSGISTFQTSLLVGNNISLSSGSVTATTFVGTLVGVATTALNLTDGANITGGTINDARLPDIITSNLNRTVGITTLNKIKVETLGVGTDTFTSDFAIVKDGTTSLEVISKTGSANIGLGSEALGGNNTARIRYNSLTQVLDFDNNGSGEVNFHVHKGTGDVVGTQTGGFFFKTGSSSKTLMNLSYDGRVSINESVPLLTDLSYSLMVNGNIKGRGRLDLDAGINAGIGTFSNLNVIGVSTFSNDQNFNTSSGFSTFYNFAVTNSLNVSGVTSFLGITTFLSVVTVGSSSAITNSPFEIYSPTTLRQSSLGLGTSKLLYDYTGGITTGFTDPRDQTKLNGLLGSPGKYIRAFGYGDYQVRTGGFSIISADFINIHPSLAVTTTGSWEGLSVAENSDMGLKYANGGNLPMIGINTTFARSIVDVGYAVTSMNSYILLPRLSTNELYYVSQLWNPNVAGPTAGNWYNHARANTSTPTGVPSGALVFDTTALQIKVGVGTTTFCGVATYTNNHSGFGAFVPPTMTTTQRNTMTTAGIQSGAIIYNSTTDRLEVRLKGAWFGITTAV